MFVNISLIKECINNKFISIQKHPSFNISIYNYTAKAQYEKMWNDATLSCRGLILDNNNNVIAKPFSKFFNYEELDKNLIPNEQFEIFDKEDGSLGILFYYSNDWHIATRGSFISEQAIKAKEILKKYDLSHLDKEYTFLFEIIYPENRIVLDYKNSEKLILLSAINIKTNTEIEYDKLINLWPDVVKRYDGIKDYKDIKQLNWENKEGFVVKFKSGFRMKIKFPEYERLHKIITNVSNKTIWENLKNGESLSEILDRVPDEFYNYVRKIEKQLKYNFVIIQENAGKRFDNLYEQYNELPNRKEYAKWVLKQPNNLHSILFNMYDKKKYSKIIWKIIKPKYEKPFKIEN